MAGTAARSGNFSVKADRTPQDGAPQRPDGHSDAFNRKWDSFIDTLCVDALRRIDAALLTVLVELLCEFDDLTTAIEADPSDLKTRSLRLRIGQQIGRMSALFGMSPADRRRLGIEPEPQEDDPMGELLAMIQ